MLIIPDLTLINGLGFSLLPIAIMTLPRTNMILATFVGTMLVPHGYQYFRSIHGDWALCETDL